jgi:hypothetical protein
MHRIIVAGEIRERPDHILRDRFRQGAAVSNGDLFIFHVASISFQFFMGAGRRASRRDVADTANTFYYLLNVLVL